MKHVIQLTPKVKVSAKGLFYSDLGWLGKVLDYIKCWGWDDLEGEITIEMKKTAASEVVKGKFYEGCIKMGGRIVVFRHSKSGKKHPTWDTLVHEFRHAWQYMSNFESPFISKDFNYHSLHLQSDFHSRKHVKYLLRPIEIDAHVEGIMFAKLHNLYLNKDDKQNVLKLYKMALGEEYPLPF